MEEFKQNTILVTGVPRSGTSLVAKIISKQDNTICFSEPKWLKELRHDKQTCKEFKDNLKEKIESIRNEIKKGNPVEITVKKGSKDIPDNYYSRTKNKIINIKETIKIQVEYSEDLIVCIKSNALFTACFGTLIEKHAWDIVSIIRDPLYILMSWRSLELPISKGKITIGEVYSSELRKIVKENNLLTKQIKILDWFFKQYLTHSINIIKYENLIKNPSSQLKKIVNIDKSIKLKSNNNSARYNSEEKESLLLALDVYGKYFKEFY